MNVLLYILLGIILLVSALSFCNVHFNIKYEKEVFINAQFLFLKFQIIPQKPKKDKKAKFDKEKKKDEKEKKPSLIKEIISKKGLSGFLSIVKQVSKFVVGELKSFFKHIIITDLDINIEVCAEDAANTALNYGKCCSVLYPAVSIIAENTNCKQYQLNITPNFNENDDTKILATARVKIKLFWLLKTAVGTLIKSSKLMIKIKTNL